MIIKTRTIIEPKDSEGAFFSYKKGDVRKISVCEKKFCCDGMKNAMKKQFIIFGEDDSYLNKDNYLNIIKTACYPSGTVVDLLDISFCPFCGEKIEIINVETTAASG
ncbi:MAG: hypothetical protein ACYDHX_08020 [Methanothrix sp.]